jgi:hypothetical protein
VQLFIYLIQNEKFIMKNIIKRVKCLLKKKLVVQYTGKTKYAPVAQLVVQLIRNQ